MLLRSPLLALIVACSAHQEVLRLRYADCVSEHHLIGAVALLRPAGHSPVLPGANIPLSTPRLLLRVPGTAAVGEEETAHVSLANPLPVPLRGGVFTAEGAGLLSATQVQVR